MYLYFLESRAWLGKHDTYKKYLLLLKYLVYGAYLLFNQTNLISYSLGPESSFIS